MFLRDMSVIDIHSKSQLMKYHTQLNMQNKEGTQYSYSVRHNLAYIWGAKSGEKNPLKEVKE